MPRVVAIDRFGGPEVLQPRTLPDIAPGPGEIRIRHFAIGVNFTDVHGRRGDYESLRALPMPLVLGMEAAGAVEATGPGVAQLRPGDRVAYASYPLGAYCDARNFPADRCVRIGDEISEITAAAVLLKGLTVHMLVRGAYAVSRGDWVVVHSAAGGVGLLAGQWLKSLGARAIGIVGSVDKVEAAQAAGYETVLVRGRDDWPALVRSLSGGGVPVVYDPVGRETWQGSLECLRPMGRLVCYGNSSGRVPPFSVNELRDRGSLAVTWVRFSDYTADPAALQSSASEVMRLIAKGVLRPRPPRCLPLDLAAEAHRLLESGASTGSLVLTP